MIDDVCGCYDHVPPPASEVPPDSLAGEFGFDFRRFGVRVPTVLISPWIEAGSVFRVPDGAMPLDLKTAQMLWGMSALTARDAAAPDLSGVFTRTTRHARHHLGMPINDAPAIDDHPINVLCGILSTPVIDLSTNRLYVCYWSSGNGNWADGRHYLASLDIATGKHTHAPIAFEGVTFDPGHNLLSLPFKSWERKQRAVLALVDGTVLVPFGTVAETDEEARGWLIAVDTRTWKQTAAWCSTARGSGGGIWMSGWGAAVQSDGSIWIVTGNGEFDGIVDFGESVVRLRNISPYANRGNGKSEVTGWWNPWTDDGRLGKNPGGEAVAARLPRRVPSNFCVGPYLASLGMEAMDETWSDQDLGASGIVLIEELGIALVSGKDGILYTVRLDEPGNTSQADLAPAHVEALHAVETNFIDRR
ncbi:alkaline phosphatase family protein [Paraburkholderia sp. 31.1]|uniref:alkaline phosphatase family protein n=1 Tax=Paraburkholderia sp. 31.1 TaxID=2615205 RepID=UPI00223A8566